MENAFHFTYIAVVLWIGAFQGFILAPVLWFRKEGNLIAIRLLSAFLAVTSCRLIFSIYILSQQTPFLNFFALFAFPVNLLYGPLYFLYLKSYIEKSFRISKPYYWHFLLPLLGLAFACIIFISTFPEERNLLELARSRELPRFAYMPVLTVILQTVFYVSLGLRLILKYRNYIRSEASFSENKHIQWLTSLNFLLLLPSLSVVFVVLIDGIQRDGSLIPVPAVGVSLMLILIGILALARPDFLQGLPEILRVEKEEDLSSTLYSSSSLSKENKERYHRQLKEYMVKKEAFLDQELTLRELSGRMGINTKYLSQVINEVEKKSFIDYVNQLRIERAKELLLHPAYQYYTVLAIANEVGFKSKSAFYNAFKKFTQMTPSAYKAIKSKE